MIALFPASFAADECVPTELGSEEIGDDTVDEKEFRAYFGRDDDGFTLTEI